MSLLYTFFLRSYYALLRLVGLWNVRAREFVRSRSIAAIGDQDVEKQKNIWIHCASHGEYETAKPLILKYRKKHNIHLTFYSPSGYTVAVKETQFWDSLRYLPFDYSQNMTTAISEIKPDLVIFIQYEYWYNLLQLLAQAKIPFIYYGATYDAKYFLFRPSMGFLKKAVGSAAAIFVKDEKSLHLAKANFDCQIIEIGEVRWLQANDTAKEDYTLLNYLPSSKRTLVLGSVWSEDMELWKTYIEANLHSCNFIVAPHEVGGPHLRKLMASLPNSPLLYSEIKATDRKFEGGILLVDTIGDLKYMYRYANAAYIGGGFGAGLHNVIEAAAYRIPILVGGKSVTNSEVEDLIDNGFCHNVQTADQLNAVVTSLKDFDQVQAYQQYIETATLKTREAIQFIDKLVEHV
jgi:3-deoxy-D-manno-octulosonic-acid transferase